MAKRPGKVIKSDMVTHGGQYHISYDSASQAGASRAAAEIVGQEDGCVIVQVHCECGRDIRLRCLQPE